VVSTPSSHLPTVLDLRPGETESSSAILACWLGVGRDRYQTAPLTLKGRGWARQRLFVPRPPVAGEMVEPYHGGLFLHLWPLVRAWYILPTVARYP
jgi:hypothetical protein